MIKRSPNEAKAKQRFTKKDALDKAKSGALEGADLRGIDLSNESMAESRLAGSNLQRAKLRGINLKNADLSGADLSEANLTQADLTHANLAGANLRNARLHGAVFAKIDARGADFGHADLTGTRIVDSDFSGANLECADLSESQIISCDMSRADLTKSAFLAAELDQISAISANAKKAQFALSRISKANFQQADLAGANFTAASFSQVDFSKANLRNAGFRSTKGLSEEEVDELASQGARFGAWLPAGLLDYLRKKRLIFSFGMALAVLAIIAWFFHEWIIGAISTNEAIDLKNLPRLYQAKSAVNEGAFTILCVGDSHTSSPDVPPGMDYPTQLHALLNKTVSDSRFRVINDGREGDNSSQSASRLIERFSQEGDSIDLVVYCSGKNNGHKPANAAFLPEKIREQPHEVFPYLLKEKSKFGFSKKTIRNLKRLVDRDAMPGSANWDSVLNTEAAAELDLLIRWLKMDLEWVYQATTSKGIKMVLLDYFHPIMWVDVAYTSFSLERGIPLASIADFGMESKSGAERLINRNYRPNEYGNARIAEILYQILLEHRLIQAPNNAKAQISEDGNS